MKKRKIIIRLDGGLGNQMFMYAFAKFMQEQGYEVLLDSVMITRGGHGITAPLSLSALTSTHR